MSFRDKFRKVFRRNSNGHSSKSRSNGNSNSNGIRTHNSNGVKIEYYKRHEIPRSKFRGPFDPEHQKRLAAWSFEAAQADRPRSLDYPLSPRSTLPDHLKPRYDESEDEDVAPDQTHGVAPPEVGLIDSSAIAPLHGCAQGRQEESSGSSSTAVEFSSYSSYSTTMTLSLEPARVDSMTQIKESIRYTSPILRVMSPEPLSPKGTSMPFSPEDLTRALNAVRIRS